MNHVIIGGGPAATNAAETLRQLDADASIIMIGDEPAHSRMALPYWLADQIPREHTYTADADYFQKLNIKHINSRVTAIDAAAKKLSVADGNDISFDKLLIATGSSALALPVPGADGANVQSLWTLADTDSALQAVAAKEQPRVLMIGSGFIGFIMLNAMYKRGWKLSVVEREAHVLPRMLNAEAAALVTDWLGSKGVTLHTSTTVSSISDNNGAKSVELANGETLEVDLVIVATGVKPNLELARSAGLNTDEGIVVNPQMQTSHPDIYAAGDVAQGPALYSSGSEIHAIQPTAVEHGRVAAANMAGQTVNYQGSLSMNVLDVCGLQCASYGNWTDNSAEAMVINNSQQHIYRQLLWTGDAITGATFVGQANDLGMLTDVGMVKGLLQTQTPLGVWKQYLAKNPFDIRRPYIATSVAQKLVDSTLLGRAAQRPTYRYADKAVPAAVGEAHNSYVSHKPY